MSAEAPPLLRDPRLHLVFAITLVAVLGVSSVAPAFPAIAAALDISPGRIGLLITVFTVPGVLLTPLLGVMADRWGRRRILVPALLLFGVAGGACAFVRDFEVLLFLRFLQGMGAAPLGALNLTLVGDFFEGRRRAAAMGYNGSVLSVGTATYPALGGALALLGWWAPFGLAVVAIPVGLVALFALPTGTPAGGGTLGSYLGGVGRSLKDRRLMGLFAISLVTFILLYGAILTWLPLLIARRFGGSSLVIGLVMAAMSLTTALTSASLGRLSARFRKETLVIAGFCAYALALGALPFMPSVGLLILPAALFGLGQGLNLPSTLTLLTDLAPETHRAAVLSLNGMVLRGGQTLGPLVMGLAWTLGGFPAVYLGGAALGGLTILFLLWLFRS